MRDLLICSAGRGKLIANEINETVPGRYYNTRLVDPEMEIALSDVGEVLRGGFSEERLLRKQIGKWLVNTTEGRPVGRGGDYLYGASGFDDFRRDITRIATLKLRAAFPYLLEAHRRGEDYVDADILSRDTGQVIKARRNDLLIYQSHPGNDVRDQIYQFADLFDSEYAIVGTSCILVRGRISTATHQDIFSFFHYIHSAAYGLSFTGELPKKTDIVMDQQFFVGSFLVTPEIYTLDEVVDNLLLANIPGGVEWDNYRMEEIVEFWRGGNGNSYAVNDVGRFFERGDWLKIGYPRDQKAIDDFTAVRQGRPPRMELMRMMEIH